MNKLLLTGYRILSFDPGSRHLGIAVQDIDLDTWKSNVWNADTFHVDMVIKQDSFYNRLVAIKQLVTKCCFRYTPTVVVVELPYMGTRLQAYGALREVVLAIKQACLDWDDDCSMFFYTPSEIKKAAGVKGNSGDKTLMKKALENSDSVALPDELSITSLDEHAIDAILIGHAHLKLGLRKHAGDEDGQKKKQKRTT